MHSHATAEAHHQEQTHDLGHLRRERRPVHGAQHTRQAVTEVDVEVAPQVPELLTTRLQVSAREGESEGRSRGGSLREVGVAEGWLQFRLLLGLSNATGHKTADHQAAGAWVDAAGGKGWV